MIRRSGEEPEIVEDVKSPPSRETLLALLRAMGLPNPHIGAFTKEDGEIVLPLKR